MDTWAAEPAQRERQVEVFAQITPEGKPPEHIEWVASLEPKDYQSRIESAELVVAHAGMGSIITALELGKPLIVFPRRAELGEHRNDHQLATAKRLERLGKIQVAYSEEELRVQLDAAANPAAPTIAAHASEELLGTLKTFIADTAKKRGK